MPSRRQFLAGTAATGTTVLSGCLGSSTPYYAGEDDPDTEWWPQPGFDRIGSCYNPDQVGPTGSAAVRWSFDISLPSARPVVADGLAFVPTASAVRTVDARSGEEQWREDGGGEPMWPRSVCYHDGTLYAAQVDDPALLALDAETGERLWTFDPRGSGVRTLLVDPERPQLFTGDEERVYALDPATGEVAWDREVFGAVVELAKAIPELLVATEAGEVYGLDSQDGRGRWRRKLPGRPNALATANGEGAFVSVFGGPTVELQSENAGATAWTADVWSSDGFVVAGQTLFSAGHRLSALDVGSGDVRWSGGETAQCGPAGAGDTVYAASEDGVTAYKFGGGTGVGGLRVGATRWSRSLEGRPEQGLAVADGAVFVLTEGGEDEQSKAYALEEE